jgi:hypothetical protein
MKSMLLTHSEIIELSGRKIRPAQSASLRKMGIEHRINAAGAVVVLRSHVEKILGGVEKLAQDIPIEPNWSALNAAQEKPRKHRAA